MTGRWSRRDVLRAGLGAAGLGAAGALLSACGLGGSAAPTGGGDEGMVFLSSQLANTQESEILRRTVLAGFDRPVEFIGATNTSQFVDRIRAEAKAGTGNVALVGGVQGEFVAMAADGVLRDMTDVVEGLSDRGFNEQYLELARIDGRYAFVPWIQASYIMAARREALRFLPPDADVNALTYDQLLAWTSSDPAGDGEPAVRASGRNRRAGQAVPPGLHLPELHRRREHDLRLARRVDHVELGQAGVGDREPAVGDVRLHAGAAALRRGVGRVGPRRPAHRRAAGPAGRVRLLPRPDRPPRPGLPPGPRWARRPEHLARPGRRDRPHHLPHRSRPGRDDRPGDGLVPADRARRAARRPAARHRRRGRDAAGDGRGARRARVVATGRARRPGRRLRPGVRRHVHRRSSSTARTSRTCSRPSRGPCRTS